MPAPTTLYTSTTVKHKSSLKVRHFAELGKRIGGFDIDEASKMEFYV